MKRYRAHVIETRTYSVAYDIEAESLEEAQELAEIGDTVDEEEDHVPIAVINREIVDIHEEDEDEN